MMQQQPHLPTVEEKIGMVNTQTPIPEPGDPPKIAKLPTKNDYSKDSDIAISEPSH